MRSPFTGEVSIDIAGPRTLRYDWAALARLRAEFGKDYEKAISQAMADLDSDVLARALSCGASPAIGVEEIKKASPPLVEAVSAIEIALRFAYFGGRDPGKLASDPLQRPRETFWRRLTRRLLGRE